MQWYAVSIIYIDLNFLVCDTVEWWGHRFGWKIALLKVFGWGTLPKFNISGEKINKNSLAYVY